MRAREWWLLAALAAAPASADYTRCELRVTTNAGAANIAQLGDLNLFRGDGSIIALSPDTSVESTCESPVNETAVGAFDSESSTKWLCFNGPPWTLAFVLTPPATPRSYEITSANDRPGRDPTSWILACAASATAPLHTLDTVVHHDVGFLGRFTSYGTFPIAPAPPATPPLPPGVLRPFDRCELRVLATRDAANSGPLTGSNGRQRLPPLLRRSRAGRSSVSDNPPLAQVGDISVFDMDGVPLTLGVDESVATRCNSPAAEGALNAFDKDSNSKWLCRNGGTRGGLLERPPTADHRPAADMPAVRVRRAQRRGCCPSPCSHPPCRSPTRSPPPTTTPGAVP